MPAARPEGPAALRGIVDVSRETEAALGRYADLLTRWNRTQSLVAPSTLSALWSRHIADSAQLVQLVPDARQWLDLGSGAGFPGLVVAILLAGKGGSVTLVESNQRKAAFLREAIRQTGAAATVLADRAEDVIAGWQGPLPDAISSRALASLDELCALIAPLSQRGVTAYLHKGLNFGAERDAADEHWTFDLVEHESRIGEGVIAELRHVRRKG